MLLHLLRLASSFAPALLLLALRPCSDAAAASNSSHEAIAQWPFHKVREPRDFRATYYGQGCRLQIVFKKDLLDTAVTYSVMGQPGSGSNDGMPLKLSTADPEKHLSFVSPEAGVGPRGAYALKGSGSKEADKDFVGYGLQPMEIASACQDNAKPLASFQVHAKHGQQHWVSPTFKATSYTPPAPVKRVGAGRPLPTSSQAYVYWDDVEGGPKPQGSFVLFANATMLKQGRVGSMFVRALNHTDIPTGTERSNITVVRYNTDGNGALSSTIDSPNTAT